MNLIPRACGACVIFLAAASCTSFVQTTSGDAYLKRADASGVTLSDQMREAAAIEPLIVFPARIGLARIENGRLTDIPGDEWDRLTEAFETPAGSKNEIVPVSLFVMDLAAPRREAGHALADRSAARRDIIDRLQTGGARQHLDAIIVYEVHGTTEKRATSFSIADLTVIGAYIAPGRKAHAAGHATALMFDVRNGYPYGGADATVEKDKIAPAAFANARASDLLRETQSAAVAELAPKLSGMLASLERQMAERRAEEKGGDRLNSRHSPTGLNSSR